MADSRKVVGGGLVVTVLAGVLTNALSDKLKFLWSPSETAPSIQRSIPAAQPPSARGQTATAPQLAPAAEPPKSARSPGNRDKSIRDKSVSIDDDE